MFKAPAPFSMVEHFLAAGSRFQSVTQAVPLEGTGSKPRWYLHVAIFTGAHGTQTVGHGCHHLDIKGCIGEPQDPGRKLSRPLQKAPTKSMASRTMEAEPHRRPQSIELPACNSNLGELQTSDFKP